jgi:CubicO group peptidase (beta-lactamase class C family)
MDARKTGLIREGCSGLRFPLVSLLWALVPLSLACGEPATGSGGSPAAGGSGGVSGEPAGGFAGSSSSGLSPEEQLRERLAPLAEELVQAPFGTAASITAIRGPLRVTVTSGTLWDGGPQADEQTSFNVASVSKLLTAARIVSLASASSLGLEDPLSQHLPGVRLLDGAGLDQSGTVKLQDLLQHRSGLPHQPADLVEQAGNDFSNPALLSSMTEAWDLQLAGPPGQYRYSNLGYALLGAIVEQNGACSFADCMVPYLSELELPRSTFWPGALDENAAHGRVEVDGDAVFNQPGWYSSRYFLPFGGLWTSTAELAKFGVALAAAEQDLAAPLGTGSAPFTVNVWAHLRSSTMAVRPASMLR